MINRENLVSSVRSRLKEFNYSSLNQLNHPLLKPEEYNSLACYSQSNDMECQELLFACSGRLVHKIVMEFTYEDSIHRGWTYDDLMQSGFLGINYALENYNAEKGNFTSYSVYYIRREIIEQIHMLGNIIFIRDPHRSNLALKLPRLRDQCEIELGQEVSNSVFAEWINKNGHSKNVKNGKINGDDILKMEEISNTPSLDAFFRHEDGSMTPFLHILIDTEQLPPLDCIIEQEVLQKKRFLIYKLLDTLSEKQKVVIELYYGFDNAATCIKTGRSTFDSVAKVLEERRKEKWDKFKCQQLHTRALKKMKELVSTFQAELEYEFI